MYEEETHMHIRAHRTRRILKALTLALSVAVITVPLAHAGHADRGVFGSVIATGQVTADAGMLDPLIGDAIRAEQASPQLDPLIADAIRAEQASPRLDPLIVDAIRADKAARGNVDGSSPVAARPSGQPAQSTSDRFEWRDAGIGAAGTLVFVFLGAGAMLAVYRRGRPAGYS
jgi:hypothetical protein